MDKSYTSYPVFGAPCHSIYKDRLGAHLVHTYMPARAERFVFVQVIFLTFGWMAKIGTYTWRLVPVSKWLVTTIYKPFGPFGRGTNLHRGLNNHGY